MDVSLPVDDLRRCSRDPAFVAAVRALYDELDRTIAARNPVCTNRGVCCKFDSFGHHLFVTSAELAYFLAVTAGPLLAPAGRGFCPYQVAGACRAREGRPAGCRVFFCDPAAGEWQSAATEETLARLRAVGEQFGLAYAYVEWTEALRRLGGRIVPTETSTGRDTQGAIDSPSGAS